MTVEFAGRRYALVRGSDVDRDGMYLEATDVADSEVALEIFYSDTTHEMSLTATKKGLPLALVEWMIGEAKRQLPPLVK
jgi:hypothetical protein